MARLTSQVKGGWYPAAPEAVDAVLERLRPPAQGECLVLDPCAGQGMALLQLTQGLDGEAYAVELSEDRATVLSALLDEDKVLAPADFLRCAVSYRSFSMAWINPPYDYATGEGGRVEMQFLRRSADLLVDGGVVALVCPQAVAEDDDTAEWFEEHCSDVSVMPFPEEVRKYSEIVILGKKRKSPIAVPWSARYEWLERAMERNIVYMLPPGVRPKTFRKTEPTDAELTRLVAQSPLRFHLDHPTDKEGARPRPPMSLGVGHRALLLASGHVDGLVCPPDEPAHVIRGTARKESYVSSCNTEEDDEGNMTTRTVVSEKARLVIRVLDSEGTITTLE